MGLSKISSFRNEGFGLLRDCGNVGNVQWKYFGFCLFFTIKTRLFKRNICGWDGWEKRQDILGTERRQEPRDGGGGLCGRYRNMCLFFL